MKIEKKHIIIAIVAVVAIWLLWRKGVFGSGTGTTGSSKDGYTDPTDSLEGVISASGMSNADANTVRKFKAKVDKDTLSWKADIEDKADNNGYSYYQQLALDALWAKYYNAETGWADNTPWSVFSAIKNL